MSRLSLFLIFESGIGLVALILAWLWIGDIGRLGIVPDASDIKRAACFAPPLLALACLLSARRIIDDVPWVRRIYEDISKSEIGEFIRESSWPAFLALSVAAGVGEEMLFRGVLQVKIGLWAAAFIFGLFHALSIGYFAAAAGVGAYLGWAYSGAHSLFAPALLHAAYDLLILVLLRRRILEDDFKSIERFAGTGPAS